MSDTISFNGVSRQAPLVNFDTSLSIVIPVLNEEDNVIPMLDAVYSSLKNYNYEVILVDDGSTDRTVERARKASYANVKVVEMMRNYGQTSAMAAGIRQASGEYIITIDGDLQNDPADIPLMLEKARLENWDVVAGRRANRKDGWLVRKLPSMLANAMIRRMTGVYLHDYGCTLKLFRKPIAKNLGLYGELHRFIPVLADLQGARMTEMDVRHHPRTFGKSKYGLGRTTRVLSDLLLMIYFQRWFRKPIHLFGPLGGGMLLAGIGAIGYRLISTFLNQSVSWAPIYLGLLLLIGGLAFLVMGIFAEIQMRIYYEGQHQTPYKIRAVYQKEPLESPLHS